MSTCVAPIKPPTATQSARAELWEELRELTAPTFAARAKRLRLAGMAHLVRAERAWAEWHAGALDGTGKPDVEKPARPREVSVEIDERPVKISEWHAARATGLVRKFDRIAECEHSPSFLRMACRFCGSEHICEVGCGHRECPRCRFAHARRVKKSVDAARRALRHDATALNRDRTIREKLLTLTVPHLGAGAVRVGDRWQHFGGGRRRIEVLHSAFEGFGEWLRKYSLARLPQTSQGEPLPALAALVHFFRVFEWTEGKDGQGHPHFHLYLHGPFLRHADIRQAWARHVAIVSGEDERDDIIVDIRTATDGGNVRGADGKKRGLSDELIKYMVKDFSVLNRGMFVRAEVLSVVHLAMLGRRRRQTSSGFRALTERCIERPEDMECHECHVTGAIEYRFVARPLTGAPCETGPPCTSAGRYVVTMPSVGPLAAQLAFQI